MFFFKKEFTAEIADSIIKNIIKAKYRPSFKDLYKLFYMFEDKYLVGFLEFVLVLAHTLILAELGENAANIFASKLFCEIYTIKNENIIQHIIFKPENFHNISKSFYEFKYTNPHKEITETLSYFDNFIQPMVKNFMSSTTDYRSLALIIIDFISIQNSIQHKFYKKFKKYK